MPSTDIDGSAFLILGETEAGAVMDLLRWA